MNGVEAGSAIEAGVRRSHVPLLAAVGVVAAALMQTAMEVWTGLAPSGGWDLAVGRGAPALMWVAAAPALVRAGAEFPPWGRGAARHAALHGIAFGAWLGITNLALRLGGLASSGWSEVLGETARAMARYGPAALLLYVVLVAIGSATTGSTSSGSTTETGPTAEAAHSDSAAGAERTDVLPVPGLNRVHLVPLSRIRYLEADGDHVVVHTCEKSHRTRGTLTAFERRLAAGGAFIRIHRSSLVNLSRVREVQPAFHGDWVAVLDDGTELRIPRTRRRALQRLRGEL